MEKVVLPNKGYSQRKGFAPTRSKFFSSGVVPNLERMPKKMKMAELFLPSMYPCPTYFEANLLTEYLGC